MTDEDLIHAPASPDLSQSGQQSSAPTALDVFERIMARREQSRQEDLEREKLLAPITERLRRECPEIFRTDAEMAEIRAALASPQRQGDRPASPNDGGSRHE